MEISVFFFFTWLNINESYKGFNGFHYNNILQVNKASNVFPYSKIQLRGLLKAKWPLVIKYKNFKRSKNS
jgi:hypothetical protein